MSTEELQPSRLGTKEHWDNVYEEELANFEETGDEALDDWLTRRRFGSESVEKMVEWSLDHVPPETTPSVLEVGSGNGTLLFALVDAGYVADRILGIDYSPDAIKLAQSIAPTREAHNITFKLCDFLTEELMLLDGMERDGGHGAWDLVLDKGTFDAIALMGKDEEGKSPLERYPEKVSRSLKLGGHFLITSCNFTEEELQEKFISAETGLKYHSRIQHPTFTFGGKTGSVVASVAFQKT
ncbi:hypothetical protein JAAARDRAFT_131373 [Jaapia argillacea MUCL 33604]|uniref:Protein-lysine N-methyltransferase EFM4 n=1 Tax=Jaapia argillacea MUCL 33604 TaxID=933084 RepID=A0A067Q3C5_9AGAM|nr:hypothetical protein JAAARDRAFT_131373 [Jaapia argillacea MUCL 33604]